MVLNVNYGGYLTGPVRNSVDSVSKDEIFGILCQVVLSYKHMYFQSEINLFTFIYKVKDIRRGRHMRPNCWLLDFVLF